MSDTVNFTTRDGRPVSISMTGARQTVHEYIFGAQAARAVMMAAPLPVGTLVTHDGHINPDGTIAVFVVEAYWRGQPRLRSLAMGTTHVASVRELQLVVEGLA